MTSNNKTKTIKIKELNGNHTLANGDDVMYTIWKGSKKFVKTIAVDGKLGGFTRMACDKIEILAE
jgi:hypothetical protein